MPHLLVKTVVKLEKSTVNDQPTVIYPFHEQYF